MPTDPTPPDVYRYELTLDTLTEAIAGFTYLDAPGPALDDTGLDLNRASWEALGRPSRITVTITPADR